jgi:hypothetical protein
MRYVFESTFADLPFATRGAIVVLLIVVNVAVWAAIIYAITVLVIPSVARDPGGRGGTA